MKIKASSFFGLGLIALLGLNGCGDAKNSDTASSNSSEKAIVNGKDASKYYSQFVSKKNANGPQDIKVLSSTYSIPQFNQAYPVTLNLYIQDDGTYAGMYEETNTGQTLNLNGRWQIKGTDLILENLGTAKGAVINGHQGFILLIAKDLLTPGIKGKTFSFTI